MNFDFGKILLDIEDHIATLTLNDPDTLNAVSEAVLDGFDQALDEIEDEDNKVRCLIITGAGRGFSAGANITAMPADTPKPQKQPKKPDAGHGLETRYHPILRRLRNLHCPIITSVNGPAAGVGMSFALMGDMILASKSAFFLQAFRRIGLVPDGGSTWLLQRAVGPARARELTMMGERLSSEQALEWGMINRVYADNELPVETRKLAQELAKGPFSLQMIRELMWDGQENSYEEQLNAEREAQRIAGRSADFKEGVTAFAEKRDAEFQGK